MLFVYELQCPKDKEPILIKAIDEPFLKVLPSCAYLPKKEVLWNIFFPS